MVKIGITIGDINGIGSEVAVKAVSQLAQNTEDSYLLIGSRYYWLKMLDKLSVKENEFIKIIDIKTKIDNPIIEYGQPSALSGKISYESLLLAIECLNNNQIEALVTAPISKKSLELAGYNCLGHTEILQNAYPDCNAQMLFSSDTIKMLLLTRHVPIRSLSELISKDLIISNTLSLVENLRINFNLSNPRVALCGLNPHSGESGSIGTEETESIIPAINHLHSMNIDITGPYPADSFWKSAQNFDCVISCYHDQGLIPLKLLYSDSLVNITLGLPIIRTSPSHGTAYDIAGKLIASEKSFIAAIKQAKQLVLNRKRSTI